MFLKSSFFTLTLSLSLFMSNISADQQQKDSPMSKQTLTLHTVLPNIYGIAGPLGNRTPENQGNNATFGLVVTNDGVVLIDPGGTHKGAQKIHKLIQSITNKKVKFVINTGGQDHRWLGNDYFKKRGAIVIASNSAVKDQKERLNDILFMLSSTAGDKAMENTNEAYADVVFDERYDFSLGGIEFQIHHPGSAHSPGDSFVWLPQQQVVFSGDIVYTQRMLSMMSFSKSKSWLNAYQALAALKAKYIVPGHGVPTTMEVAHRDTYEYLTELRNKVSTFMDAGGEIQDVSQIDQTRFQYLRNYDTLKGRNVQKIYQEMEFE